MRKTLCERRHSTASYGFSHDFTHAMETPITDAYTDTHTDKGRRSFIFNLFQLDHCCVCWSLLRIYRPMPSHLHNVGQSPVCHLNIQRLKQLLFRCGDRTGGVAGRRPLLLTIYNYSRGEACGLSCFLHVWKLCAHKGSASETARPAQLDTVGHGIRTVEEVSTIKYGNYCLVGQKSVFL